MCPPFFMFQPTPLKSNAEHTGRWWLTNWLQNSQFPQLKPKVKLKKIANVPVLLLLLRRSVCQTVLRSVCGRRDRLCTAFQNLPPLLQRLKLSVGFALSSTGTVTRQYDDAKCIFLWSIFIFGRFGFLYIPDVERSSSGIAAGIDVEPHASLHFHTMTTCLPIRYIQPVNGSSVLVTGCPLRCRAQTFDPPLCRGWRQSLSLSASIIHLFLFLPRSQGIVPFCFGAHSLFFTLP